MKKDYFSKTRKVGTINSNEIHARQANHYGIDFGAEFEGLSHSLGVIDSGSEKLCIHSWYRPDARGNLLLVHGYLDHVGLFRHLVRYGLERGYNVVAFDLPGHGLSTGDRAAIDDFRDYSVAVSRVRKLMDDWPGHWHVIAQSTGGAAMLGHQRRHLSVSRHRFVVHARLELLLPPPQLV